jgi:hypothetical protein
MSIEAAMSRQAGAGLATDRGWWRSHEPRDGNARAVTGCYGHQAFRRPSSTSVRRAQSAVQPGLGSGEWCVRGSAKRPVAQADYQAKMRQPATEAQAFGAWCLGAKGVVAECGRKRRVQDLVMALSQCAAGSLAC